MNRTTQYASLKRQRGVSLPVALILLVPLTLLGVTLANRNNLEEMMASSQRDGQQSLMNAESGLAMGHQALETLVLNKIAGGTGLTVDETLSLADPYSVVSYDGTAITNYSLTEGSVTVVVMDNDDGDNDLTSDADGQLILRSTGSYQSGERVVEALVALVFPESDGSGSLPPLTIFTEEYLKINGKPEFSGEGGANLKGWREAIE